MMTWRKALGLLICVAIYSGPICPLPSMAAEPSIKTSFKRYTIYTYKGEKVICEPYRVAKDDWLYKLFRQKGEISEKDFPLFITIFKVLNPGISNIDTIKTGQEIIIPLKTVLQDYFRNRSGSVEVPVIEFDTLKKKPHPYPIFPKPMDKETIARLEQYAEMQHGELMGKGKYYFPAKGDHDLVLNLESTPMIILKDNSRLILVQENRRDEKLETAMNKYWKEITVVDIETALKNVTTITSKENIFPKMEERLHPQISLDHNMAIRELLNYTGIDYISDAVISFSVGTIRLTVKLLKIPRPGLSHLVVETGDVYGSALDSIRKEGYEVLALLPGETTRQIAIKLFSNLGMDVVEEPSFINAVVKKTIIIPGIYIEHTTKKLLLAEKLLDLKTSEFLKRQGIILLYGISPKS